MRWIKILRLRLRSSFRRDRVERELDEELRDHLALETESKIAGGMSAPQARDAALRAIAPFQMRADQGARCDSASSRLYGGDRGHYMFDSGI